MYDHFLGTSIITSKVVVDYYLACLFNYFSKFSSYTASGRDSFCKFRQYDPIINPAINKNNNCSFIL